MVKANDPHPVTVILRDWTKTNKGNNHLIPVAETHSQNKRKVNKNEN